MPGPLTELRDAQIASLVIIRKVADAIDLMTRDTSAGHATLAEVRADVDGLLLKIEPKGGNDARL